MQACPRTKLPTRLPHRFLVNLAATRGLSLFLDYDGTLAPIVTDPARAIPVAEVPATIDLLVSSKARIVVAIVTGRRIDEVRKLLGLQSPALFSGVHGMEFTGRQGKNEFIAPALACRPSLARVRRWLQRNVPPERGFRIEDKVVAVGLHCREADPVESRTLGKKFAAFVERETPDLKLLHLKMLLEAVPRAAGKGRAVKRLTRRIRKSYVTVYFGDDTTDEDAFGALGDQDIGILVGAKRPSLARYRVAGPRAVARELESLVSALRSD